MVRFHSLCGWKYHKDGSSSPLSNTQRWGNVGMSSRQRRNYLRLSCFKISTWSHKSYSSNLQLQISSPWRGFPTAINFVCSLSIADFMSIITPVVTSGVFPNFVPVVDGDFVPIHPRDSIASGSSRNHDLMTGFAHHDGAGLIYLNPLGTSPKTTQWCLIA